jgi:hypothetical protein
MRDTELAQRLQALDPSAKVLLMSAYNVADITASGHPSIAKPSLQMRSLRRSARCCGFSPRRPPTRPDP